MSKKIDPADAVEMTQADREAAQRYFNNEGDLSLSAHFALHRLATTQAPEGPVGSYPEWVWYTPEDNSSRKYVRDDLYEAAVAKAYAPEPVATTQALDAVERLIASAKGHLANIRAHGNAEANACLVIDKALNAALSTLPTADAGPVAELDIEATAENIARHLARCEKSGRIHAPAYQNVKAGADYALSLYAAPTPPAGGDGLVKRLRMHASGTNVAHLLYEAADALEALSREGK